MYGFHNRLLHIDLSSQTWAMEGIPDDTLGRYLGGKGLGVHLLLEKSPPGVDPLAPENPLIVTTGPASGTVLAPASRYGLFSKSPLTGLFGESYSGGHVAPKIKATGYDAILVRGESAEPVYLEISDQAVHFHDATACWGMDAYQSEEFLEAASGVRGAKAIVIGPAGERRVPFALVGNDRGRQAGRTGMGAVMGAKQLKGIVFHGGADCPLHDPGAVRSYDRQLRERGKDNARAATYRSLGTPAAVAVANVVGAFPSYYWSRGTVPFWEKISGEMLAERFQPRAKACYRCFFACGKITTIPSGRHAGLRVEGPEYETICAFGGQCGVDDLAEILYLNDICDRLGMDTITAGNVAGFAIEASRRGVLELDLDYGDVDGIAALLRQMANQEGMGALLSQGVRVASEELGLEDLAVHVKGLEPPAFDPRALKGMGLAYAVADRGACHLRATVYKAEFRDQVDRTSVDGKAELVLEFEDRDTVFDTLILCRFYRDMIGWGDLTTIIRGLTGLEMDQARLKALSADIANAVRRYNLREGMTAADDTLPQRLLNKPLQPRGERLTADELERMLAEYYTLRGWERS
jgi:aldehyde:ferredoxin oxidoreductase